MTILLYVRRKEWSLDSVTVECSRSVVHQTSPVGRLDRKRIEKIGRRILLKGDLTDEQRDRIKYIARRCPVHRTLESSPQIEDEVEVVIKT